MMKLLQKLKFWHKPNFGQTFVPTSEPITKIEIPGPRGGMRKVKHSEYTPDTKRRGGRVVKAMPKELRRIKEEQEKVEDDNTLDIQKIPS